MAAVLLLVVLLGAATATAGILPDKLSLIDTDQYAYARCMDGTPGGYYFRAASTPASRTRWVFSLEGGGECVNEATCKGRLQSSLGSSKYFAPSMYMYQLQVRSWRRGNGPASV